MFDASGLVQSIEARGGMVVAGGAALYFLEPGHERWVMHPPPEETGPVHVVAVEPRGARRYAVASAEMLAVISRRATKDGDAQVLGVKPRTVVRQLAWGGAKGPSTLYFLLDDGSLMRMKSDLSSGSRLNVEAMAALASDDRGVIATAALHGDRPRVYVTRGDAELAYRSIDHEIDPDASVQVAVADAAVALVVDGKYVLVSRGLLAPFERVEVLGSPEGSGRTTGPIAFEGASSDAALLCARWEKGSAGVVRVDASGASMRIFEIMTTGPEDAPEIAALSWDASRRAMWGASPDAGIFAAVPPDKRGKKKIALS